MISVLDLVEGVDFQPEVIYLEDNKKTIKVNYHVLKDKFSHPLNCLLELIPVEGHVYFVNHAWNKKTDIYCDTSILELLRQIDEEQYGARDQNTSKYLLMIQDALTDLSFGDKDSIMELIYLIKTSEE